MEGKFESQYNDIIFKVFLSWYCNNMSYSLIYRHEDVNLDARSQHIIRYRPVKDLIPTGAVDLVWNEMCRD